MSLSLLENLNINLLKEYHVHLNLENTHEYIFDLVKTTDTPQQFTKFVNNAPCIILSTYISNGKNITKYYYVYRVNCLPYEYP